MFNKIKNMTVFFLVQSNIIIGQQTPNVENIFIGSFYTFDPYIVSEYQLKRDAPSFNINQIFFWISDDSLDSSINKKLVLDLKDNRESSFNFKLYQLDQCVLNDSIVIRPGHTIHFIFDCRNYSSLINSIYYYEGWSKGFFASIDIPSELNVPPDNFISPRFPLIGSLGKNMKIYLNRFSSGQYHDEVYSYQEYTIKSHLIDTGRYGYFDSKIYDSFLSVEYQNKEIYRVSSESKLFYLVGDLGASSLISLYIVEGFPDGIMYSLLEFSGNKFSKKSYFHESVE